MKEKKYKLPEDNQPCMVAEPTPSYHGNAAVALPEDDVAVDEFEDDDVDWDKIPVGFYPANEEEAIARIEAIEEEYERTGECSTTDEFIQELKAEGLWLI